MIKKLLFASAIVSLFFTNAQTTVFKEDFEDEASVAQWKIFDRDGDGESWEFLNAELNELPNFSGNLAVSFSWYLEAFTPDNLLESPSIALPNSNTLSLSFKAAAGDDELFEEHYALYIIPATSTFTGSETPVFEETFDAGYLDVAKIVSVDISSYKGQNVKLVFRHYACEDIFYMGIDDVEITDNAGMAVSESIVDAVQVYPNPAVNIIKIKGLEAIQRLKIFDMNGRLVLENAGSEADVSNLAKGQYILNVHTPSQIVSKKLIKQ